MLQQILSVFNFTSLGTQTISDEKEYDPFKSPPNFNLAQQHKVASKFSVPLDSDTKPKICPCCGYSIVLQEINLDCSRYDLNFNGAGYPLFFEFIAFATVFTTIIGLISGIFTTWENSLGDRCDFEERHNNQNPCNYNTYNTYSLSNRTNELTDTQVILDLVTCIVMIMSTIYYRRFSNVSQAELQNAYIAISDFSIQVNNLPKNATEEEITEFFSTVIKNDQQKKLDIKRVIMTYNIADYNQLIEERMKKKYLLFNSSIDKKDQTEEIEEELNQIENKIKQYEDNPQENFKFSGVALITYNKSSQARAVRRYYQLTRIGMMLHKILVIFTNKDYQQFRNKIIYVERAPEPGDVLWENLGINPWKQWKYQQLTNVMAGLLLIVCFFIILGISIGQEAINQTESGQATTSFTTALFITILGVSASLAVSVINILLGQALRQLVNYEKPSTMTAYNTSVAVKLGLSQFMNTAIIPLLVNIVLAQSEYRDRLWMNGGLNSDITLVLLVNSIFPPVIAYFDPYYFYLLYLERRYMQEGEQCTKNQKEVNDLFEGPQCDLAKKYAIIAKTLLATCFYATLLPLGIPMAIVSFILIYWVEKFLLLRRYSRGPPIGEGLPDEMIDFYVELTILMFSAGNCIWQYLVFHKIHVLTWIQLGISVVVYFVPLGVVFESIINVGEVKIKATYEASRKNIWDDYSRRNPLTMNKAMDEWIKELQQEEAQLIEESHGKSPNRNVFRQLTRKIVDINKIKKLQHLRQAQQQTNVIRNIQNKQRVINFFQLLFQPQRGRGAVVPLRGRQMNLRHAQKNNPKQQLKLNLKKAQEYLEVPHGHVQVVPEEGGNRSRRASVSKSPRSPRSPKSPKNQSPNKFQIEE